ncbi:MAG: flagellar biosynthetic protein FliO [Lachnospiraceae bacterium]|nr:flagellar biosynthetic protein FliO [Lachnospiraceae bacterium]
MLLVFLLVIVACYFVTRFVGGKQLKQQKNSNFTVLETFRLAQNKYLQLIQMGSRYFVLAVCKDSITVVTELLQEEIPYWREQTVVPGFSEILQKFKKEKTGENDEENVSKENEE